MAKKGFTERDYLAVAKKKIITAQEVADYPKFLFYARKKQGKTTLALTAGTREEVLVVDPEKGAQYKKNYNAIIWPVEQWEDMQDVYGALRTGKLSPKMLGKGKSDQPFKWVVIDGLTRINNFAVHYVRREQEERDLSRHPGFVDRRDYGKSGELLKQLLTNFHGLRMGVIYTAQERMKSLGDWDDDDDGEGAEYIFIPEIPDSVRNQVNSLVDVIGRVYTVKVEKDGSKPKIERRLRIGVSERFDTGARSEFELPDVLRNPTVPKLQKLMAEGMRQ